MRLLWIWLLLFVKWSLDLFKNKYQCTLLTPMCSNMTYFAICGVKTHPQSLLGCIQAVYLGTVHHAILYFWQIKYLLVQMKRFHWNTMFFSYLICWELNWKCIVWKNACIWQPWKFVVGIVATLRCNGPSNVKEGSNSFTVSIRVRSPLCWPTWPLCSRLINHMIMKQQQPNKYVFPHIYHVNNTLWHVLSYLLTIYCWKDKVSPNSKELRCFCLLF